MALGRKKDVEPSKEKKLSKKEVHALKKQQEKEKAAREEEERLQAEREALMALTEKELLVELIMTVRGYNERIKKLEKQVSSADSSANLAALNSSVANMNASLNRLR